MGEITGISLGRDDLSSFLPNPRAIKAFESLTKAVSSTLPGAIDDVQAAADSAASRVAVAEGIALLAFQIAQDLLAGPPPVPAVLPDAPDELAAQVNSLREQVAMLTAAVAAIGTGPTP